MNAGKLQSRSINRGEIAGSPRYIAALTGIRTLAALLVLGLHIGTNLPSDLAKLLPFFDRGYLGVDLFFILSGYIITHVYWKPLARLNPVNLRVFLWHRLIRLYPVHLAVLLLLLILSSASSFFGVTLNHPEAFQWTNLLQSVILFQVWNFEQTSDHIGLGWNIPSWSISAEFFAYLLFPLIASTLLVLTRSAARSIALAAAALVATVIAFKLGHRPLGTIYGAFALVRVTGEFICGASLCRGAMNMGANQKAFGDPIAICGLLALVLGASTKIIPDFALLPFLAMMVWGAATAHGAFAQFLSRRLIVWLGEISYSMYMIHMTIIWVMRRGWEYLGFSEWHQTSKLLAVFATTLTIVLGAAILYYLVEWPARIRFRDLCGKLNLPISK
jgi:peptidoglycan/LPS O-acetylase OafA/YrhL